MKKIRVPRIVLLAMLIGISFLFGQALWAYTDPTGYNEWAARNGWPQVEEKIATPTVDPNIPYCVDTKNIDWQNWNGERLVKQSAAGTFYTFYLNPSKTLMVEHRTSINDDPDGVLEYEMENGRMTVIVLASFVEEGVELTEAFVLVRCGDSIFIGQISLPTDDFKKFIG